MSQNYRFKCDIDTGQVNIMYVAQTFGIHGNKQPHTYHNDIRSSLHCSYTSSAIAWIHIQIEYCPGYLKTH